MTKGKGNIDQVGKLLKQAGLEKAPESVSANVMHEIDSIQKNEDLLLNHLIAVEPEALEKAPEGLSQSVMVEVYSSNDRKFYSYKSAFWMWLSVTSIIVTGLLVFIGGIEPQNLLQTGVGGSLKLLISNLETSLIYGLWALSISLVWWVLDFMISEKNKIGPNLLT